MQIFLLWKSYANSKIANNRLKGRTSWPSEVDWWSHDAMLRKKWKNMVIFGAHTFVNCANNLYASKILSLNSTITHYSGQYADIFKNKRICTKSPNRRNTGTPTFVATMIQKFWIQHSEGSKLKVRGRAWKGSEAADWNKVCTEQNEIIK